MDHREHVYQAPRPGSPAARRSEERREAGLRGLAEARRILAESTPPPELDDKRRHSSAA